MGKSMKTWMLLGTLSLIALGGAAGCHDHDDRDQGGYWNSQENHQVDRDNEGRSGDHNGMNDRR